jgi:phenylpropionate dioxygenase-like ring-hydroxylating dioxygenase large terminal subunit
MSYWLKNAWYCALYADELPVGAVAGRVICNEPIVLWRGQDDVLHSIEDRCPHRYAPLSMGAQAGRDRIRCGYHGLEFDGSGVCVHNPHGKGQIPRTAALKAYPVHEYCGMIWVWMGLRDPDLALLPDLSPFLPTSPLQQGGRGSLKMDVPFELVVDNVMDLSHAALLHEGILGNDQSIAADTEVGEVDGRVYATRWMPDIDPPEYLDLIWKGDGANIDMWHDVSWSAPANLLLDVGATSPGSTKEQGTRVYAQHIVTPVTDTSCMYFFMSARRNPPVRSAEDDARIQQRLFELRRMAFAEQDAPMIRAQYEVILRQGEYRPILLPGIDKAVVIWRRRFEKMLREEQASEPAKQPLAPSAETLAPA